MNYLKDMIGWMSHDPLLPHLKVFLPLEHAVALGDLRLKELESAMEVARQVSDYLPLPSTPTSRAFPPELLDDVTDTRQMLQEVPAQLSVCMCVCVCVCGGGGGGGGGGGWDTTLL